MKGEIINSKKPKRWFFKRFLLWTGWILLLFAIIASAYFYFLVAKPMGSGPAGRQVNRLLFQKPWTQQNVVLLGLGDSITDGFGAAEGYSYFDRLAANPGDEFEDMKGFCLSKVIPNLQTMNLAVSGTTSLHHYKHISRLKEFSEDSLGIIVISTGGNDIIHNYGRTLPSEGAMYGVTIVSTET